MGEDKARVKYWYIVIWSSRQKRLLEPALWSEWLELICFDFPLFFSVQAASDWSTTCCVAVSLCPHWEGGAGLTEREREREHIINIAVNACCASDSCLHVTLQVVHSFVTTKLHSKQSSTKEPAIVAEGYLMCRCFSYKHSAAGFSALSQK